MSPRGWVLALLLALPACAAAPCDPNGIVRCAPAQGYQRAQGGTVVIGMHKDQVRYALGTPRNVYRLQTAVGTQEQWEYGYGPSARSTANGTIYVNAGKLRYVYFEGDRVVAIQD